jgi:methionine-rich copper-binding protein CopC
LEERQLLSLVASYGFNEGKGSILNDLSGNGNDGTIRNATWTRSGKYGGALTFNGSNSLVTVKDSASLHLGSTMTIEAWVNPKKVDNSWRDVVFKNDSIYYLEATSPTRNAPAAGAKIGGQKNLAHGPSALPTNSWTYLAATYDGSTLRLYINGYQSGSVTKSGSIANSSNPLQIGGDGILGQFFNGAIDEVRIYNNRLSPAQIRSDMKRPVATVPVVTSESPAPGATGVVNTSVVTATFNEPVVASSITTSNFVLKDSKNNVIPAKVSYAASTRTATLTPSSPLSPAMTYTASISGVKDGAGRSMSFPFSWKFTVSGTVPRVTSQTPAPGATGVATSSPVKAVFNEAIQSSTMTFTLKDSSGTAVPSTVSYDSTSQTATLTPKSELGAGTYTATISGVKDAAGNVIAAPVTWTFSTATSSSSLKVSAGGNLTSNIGSSVSFAGTVSGGTSPYTYSWDFGDGTSAAAGDTGTFVNTDTTTKGNWSGTYGAAGYNVIGSKSSYPSYATITPSGQSSWTWASSTTDSRGLLIPGSSSSRIAAAWFSNSSFSIDVNLTDGLAHKVSLYALDWDSQGRSEQIKVVDPTDGTVLDTQTVSGFSGGKYLTWNVSGHVKFIISSLAGPNAVLSGLFLGTGSSGSGSTLKPSHVYMNPGTYTATLTVHDSAGRTGSSKATVTVKDVAPTVTYTDPPNYVGQPVSFTATATSISPAVQAAGFTYTWNFGDGSTGSGASTTHTYAKAGTYNVSVTATDSYGMKGTSSGTVTITSTPASGSGPKIIGESPDSGATGVDVPDAVLLMSFSATFNEPVQPSSINFTLADSSGKSVPITTNYSDSTNTITAWPQVMLKNSATYKITVSGAKDSSGNVMSSYSWSFSTASASAATIPTVSSVSPSYNASVVDVGTPIAVNFNEPVVASSIGASNFTLKDPSGKTIPATISYSEASSLHTATLTPKSPLAYSTTYTVTISGVKDAAGRTMSAPYSWSFVTASGSQTYSQLPLLYPSNLQYIGAFRVPYGGTTDRNSFSYNNEGVAYNPAKNSLFLAGFGWSDSIGEIGIPSTIVNSTDLVDLATASLLQAPNNNVWDMIPDVSNLVAGSDSGVCIGGLQVVNGQLIGTLWDYYDTTGSTIMSHFRFDSLNLSTAKVEGMFQVGTNGLNAGYYAGYMSPIPSAWQAALGAPYLTGSVTQNIVSRTSNGPGAFGFDPKTLSTSKPSTTIPYVYYPSTTPLGYPLVDGYTVTNPLYNGTTNIAGAFFAPGSSSVLFYGSTGTNTMTYGTGDDANDHTMRGGGKGPHSVNGDYAFQVWAYNANDLLAAKEGLIQPWELQPYATWNIDFPVSEPAAMLGGVAFDPSSNRLYVVENGADTENSAYLPLVQVYQLTLSPPPSVTSTLSLQSPSVTTSSTSDASAKGAAVLSTTTSAAMTRPAVESSNLAVTPTSSITTVPTTQARANVSSSKSSAPQVANSVSIVKRLPAQDSIMPRTRTLLGLSGKKTSSVF